VFCFKYKTHLILLNYLIEPTTSITAEFRCLSTSVCPGRYTVDNAAWSRVFTEQIMTMMHSSGNVETVMNELGCRNFIHSSEFEIQNP